MYIEGIPVVLSRVGKRGETVPQPSRCTEMPMLPIWTNPFSHFYAKYRPLGKGLAGGGGGGGTLNFSSYIGSGPASSIYPKKYQEFQAPQNNIWNLSNPKKYPPFCALT